MPYKTSQRDSQGLDPQLVHAVGNTLRVQALTVLAERTASPNEIATELSKPLNSVSHHVKVLLKLGWIEAVRTAQRRGAVEHYYRAVVRPKLSTEEWSQHSLKERQRFSLWIVQLLLGDATEAFDAKTFDARADRHLSRVPLYVDKKGWAKITRLQNDLLDAYMETEAESAERMINSEEESEGIHASAVMFCIEMPVPKQPLDCRESTRSPARP
jgi:DNA-binding transcriptional ArsR family regulator